MKVQEALMAAIALLQAVAAANAAGSPDVALTPALEAADDEAREDLAEAIESAEQKLTEEKP